MGMVPVRAADHVLRRAKDAGNVVNGLALLQQPGRAGVGQDICSQSSQLASAMPRAPQLARDPSALVLDYPSRAVLSPSD